MARREPLGTGEGARMFRSNRTADRACKCSQNAMRGTGARMALYAAGLPPSGATDVSQISECPVRNAMKWMIIAFSLIAGAIAPAMAAMNVLVIMTDDQRFDTLSRMPNISDLAAQGVTFSNAFMPTPLCGPSRAMLFSGGYRAQNTGVLSNSAPNGGAKIFKDADNLGAELQTAGYRTQFVGKWINGYEGMGKYVPPGWTKWVGRHSFATTTSWSAFQYTIGTSGTSSSVGAISTSHQYTTEYERDQVLNFIGSTPAGQPFFILWATSAPHPPAHPATQDANLFPSLCLPRSRLQRDRSERQARLGTRQYQQGYRRICT